MTFRTLCSASVVVLTSLAAVGCSSTSDDDPSIDSMSDEALTSSIRSKLSPIKGSFEKPSGVVDAKSMPKLIDSMENSSDASDSSNYSGTPFALPKSSGIKPKNFAFPNPARTRDANQFMACFSGDSNTLTYDMGCLSNGETTGTMVWRAVYDQTNHQNYSAMIKINNVCSHKEGGGCMNGEMFMESLSTGTPGGEDTDMTLTIYEDLEITSPTYSGRIKFGMRMRIRGGDSGSFSFEMTAYDGDSSFVYEQTSGGLSVTGSNGKFECTYEDDGEHGSCTSSSGEKWSW